MTPETVIEKLRSQKASLQQAGIRHAGIFGSTARRQDTHSSDVDIVIDIDPSTRKDGFAGFGQIETLKQRLSEIIGSPVDVVVQPIRDKRLASAIDRDRIDAF